MDRTKKSTDAQIRASAKYNVANTKQYPIRLNINTDGDIIKHLETVPSVAGYIKDLIRDDMKKG